MPFVSDHAISLYYEIQGEGEDPVLLLHGLGSDASTWSDFFPAVRNEFRLIALENRGSGRSSKPAGSYTTGEMAQDAITLLDSLRVERAHVVGKSLGGMIAQVFAAMFPERVKSLVLASSLLKHDGYGEELLQLGRTVAQKAGLFETFRHAFLLSYSREYCMKNRSRLAEMEALLQKVGSQELLQGYLGQSKACEDHDATELAGRIQAPTLVIVGKDDIITTADQSRELAAAIPNAELRIFPNGGHGFWREFPDDVNQVVREFLIQHR